jgi:hypothetical protein
VNDDVAPHEYPPGSRIILYCPLLACPWQHDGPPLPEGSGSAADEAVADVLAKHFAGLEEAVKAHLETHTLLEWVQELARLRDSVNTWSRHLLHTSQHGNMQIALGGRIQGVAEEMRQAVGLPEFGWNDAVPDAEFGECSVHASGGCRGQETHP